MNDFPSTKHRIELDYADFISQFPWDVYSTVTFREERKDPLYWTQRLYDVLERFNATRAFVAVERHKAEGIHLHSLSRHLPQLSQTKSLWRYAFKAFGRSRFEFVRDSMPVTRYCAKYVVKGNQFDFKGDISAWQYDRTF